MPTVNRNRMNLRQIEAFRTVMRAGSVTAAAVLLRLSQPTISKLIAQLEHTIKLKLFDRTSGRLVPRPEAHSLLRNVDQVFHALDDVGRYAEQLARSQTGHIRIAATASLGAYFLPLAVADFMTAHPDVRVTLRTGSTSYVKEWVASQQADIGFVTDSPPATGMITERFQERPEAVCLLPHGHRLATKKAVGPKDLLNTRVISVDRDTPFNRLIQRALTEAGVSDQMVLETNRAVTAWALVSQGVGVTVVNPFAAFCCHSQGNVLLRPFLVEVKFSVDIIRATGQLKSLLIEKFLGHVSKQKKIMETRLRKAFVEGLPK
jgi:DNA-binding transcriptional LysR family regulator